ncbi:hypothetical protein V2I01_41880 [Micromonospora sp. BRA006-A]|nr:hypothetical protein [Micromonospora sp. BRA006-A]
MSTATWASGADASALFRTAADRVRAIDVHIRDALYAPGGSYRWPRHRINEVELEWRRWRLRHHLGLRDEPPASIRLYERLAVSAGVPPADVSPLAGGGPLVDATYDQMFPQGPLIIRAVKSRVVRPTDHEVDEEYAALLRESSGRRSDYLSMLDPSGYYWHMPDLISAATARECMKDVEVLLAAPRGESFAGGPQPGWDVEHDALVSRSMNAYLGAGPTLIKIHEDPALVAEISARMGRPMHPTRCTYLLEKRATTWACTPTSRRVRCRCCSPSPATRGRCARTSTRPATTRPGWTGGCGRRATSPTAGWTSSTSRAKGWR